MRQSSSSEEDDNQENNWFEANYENNNFSLVYKYLFLSVREVVIGRLGELNLI